MVVYQHNGNALSHIVCVVVEEFTITAVVILACIVIVLVILLCLYFRFVWSFSIEIYVGHFCCWHL